MINHFNGSGSSVNITTAQKKLAQSIVNTVREPVLLVDKSGVIVNTNNGFCATFNLEKEEIIAASLAEFEIFQELEKNLLGNKSSGEKTEALELWIESEDSREKKFLINASSLGDRDDALILISFKEADFKLEEARGAKDDLKNFHEIFSQAPAVICVLKGPEHIFDLANENYLRLVGNRDIIGKSIREALPEIENQGFFEMLDGVYTTGEVFKGNELQVKLDVGEKELKHSYMDFVYQPILNPSKEVTGIFVHAIDVSEKVSARKKIEESENELRKLIDTVPAIIWITRADGENYYLNKNWYKYTGQTVGEGNEFGWLDAVHPDERNAVRNNFIKSTQREEDFHTSFRLRNSKGEYRWVLDSGSPKYNAEGKYEGMIGIVIDVHEEKLKEQLVREKEHRIRSIIEEATVATALYTGRDMKIEIANDAMIELWGKDHSVIGATLREALPELEGQPFHDLLQQVYNTGNTYWGREDPVDLMIDNKLHTGYFNFTYKALYNENGDIYGILNMAVDVTEMVKSKELLKESESRFRQLADLMPEKVANTDADGNFIYFNQGWLDYTGLDSNELIRNGWASFIHPSEKQEFLNSWKYSLDTGTDFEMEFRYLNKKDKYKWHLSRAEAVTDENGNIQMWICTATEIQKIKAEEKRKEDFLKMVSHELKTPITSIKGYVHLLLSILKTGNQEQFSPASFQTYLERVDHQIGRLTRLISEMLDLSRIEKNKLEFQKEIFSLNKLVEETVQDIGYTNTEHNISISSDYKCNVYGDKDRIGQVLINLMTNSIKYSPSSPDIDVKIQEVGGGKVSVSVKDYGIGIDKENQKKIFKRFYRVDGNNEETYSGFGIGLYLANEIIRRHNGTLGVKSELGEGAVFTFTLEVAEKE